MAGNEAFKKIKSYNIPKSFSVHVLPELEEYKQIDATYKNNIITMDINGQAVSIECFLDLNLENETPKIILTNLDEKDGKYQGSFSDKIKNMLKLKFEKAYENNFSSYDTSKLKQLTEFIIQKAKEING